ncbi:MAG: cell envelope integrity protein TolA, partial [Rickettsia endosymbiont of Ixodes persulcatus]|nr:cell envelope integrity protein TolA [Rickettsia endosymbiont of Ixodes persulcatus]
VEKSPVTLSSKRKPPKLVNTSSDIKSNLKKLAPSQKKHSDKLVQHKSNIMEKKKHPVVSKKSLQLAQKNVQQLLQQEVNTLVKKHQLAVQNTATTEKYRHLILQSIAQQWIIPPELNKHLEAKLVVRLAPGGMVLEVIVVKSSGNAILDRSAQTAVYKASPLPVPKSNLFNTFRQINLTVRPEGVLTQ